MLRERPFDFYGGGLEDFLKKNSRTMMLTKKISRMIEQTKKYPGQCLRKLSVLMANKQKLVNKDFKCQLCLFSSK